ncbi:MAG TPA: S8 family serine peptidase [Gaiellaceae bacterium]|nr:S8 family serine peptidase [Gaiellaceae bacterium]
MRLEGESGAARASALWGKGFKGELRSSALWGKGGRGFVASLAVGAALALAAPAAASGGCGEDLRAYVPATLVKEVCAEKGRKFNVIVQGRLGEPSARVASEVDERRGTVKRRFRSITGVSGELTGGAILALARDSHVRAITPDSRVVSSYQNAEMWRESVRVDQLWQTIDPVTGAVGPAPQAPAIAIVDSGVDAAGVADFGARVVASVNVSSRTPEATGDDQGHGTMVAGVAAGASPASPGVAQNAPVVSVRTSDANGMSITSDVVAAADWILGHKDEYGIRVANFSLTGSLETTFRFDPLNAAVQRLWLNDVVVVVAAGNHGTGAGEVSMSYAPANDPFVITVGAVDPVGSGDPLDDSVPWWSGYGLSLDGFSKPDVAAPGRYMVMPVPGGATIPQAFPERVVGPGYMWMSGTSFAAPVVSGTAAQLLARHPDWGPDEVKGALMLTANYLEAGANWEAGVGEVDAAYAASLDFVPPNPNEGFLPFVERDSASGQRVFNEAAWSRHIEEVDPSWTQANWSSAAWSRAAWSRAAWSRAAWSRAHFDSELALSSATSSTATGVE